MKCITFCCCVLLFLFPGCSMREREKELEEKINVLNQKEQELLLKEKSLQLKEHELAKKAKVLDSTLTSQNDSVAARNPHMVGTWNVKMHCTETTCSGSAVGDVKTEQWEIAYQDNAIIAKAMAGNTLLRTYTGNSSGNTMLLTARSEDTSVRKLTTINVRIIASHANEMEGQREITRADDCRILYALEMKRK